MNLQQHLDLYSRLSLSSPFRPQVQFIEKNTGSTKSGTFQEWLKSGEVLCKYVAEDFWGEQNLPRSGVATHWSAPSSNARLINALQPGAIKRVNNSDLAFKQVGMDGWIVNATLSLSPGFTHPSPGFPALLFFADGEHL